MIDERIAGDFCAQNRVEEENEKGIFEHFSAVQQVVDRDGLSIVNLEAPLIDVSGNYHAIK